MNFYKNKNNWIFDKLIKRTIHYYWIIQIESLKWDLMFFVCLLLLFTSIQIEANWIFDFEKINKIFHHEIKSSYKYDEVVMPLAHPSLTVNHCVIFVTFRFIPFCFPLLKYFSSEDQNLYLTRIELWSNSSKIYLLNKFLWLNQLDIISYLCQNLELIHLGMKFVSEVVRKYI